MERNDASTRVAEAAVLISARGMERATSGLESHDARMVAVCIS